MSRLTSQPVDFCEGEVLTMHSPHARAAARYSRRRGVTAVEFAMVSPLVFFFFFGAVELCRTNIIRHTADDAAYEAARVAIAPGATSAEAIDKAKSILRMAGIRSAKITLDPATITEKTLTVKVDVQVPMKGNGWLPVVFTRGIAVGGEASLKTERAPLVQATAVPTPKPTTKAPPKAKPPKKSSSKSKSNTTKKTNSKKGSTKKSNSKTNTSKSKKSTSGKKSTPKKTSSKKKTTGSSSSKKTSTPSSSSKKTSTPKKSSPSVPGL